MRLWKDKLTLLFLGVLLAGCLLRLINLGYSDYQGDEIKALYLAKNNQITWNALLDQRKGPIEFLIPALMKAFDPDENNQFLMRLPFALCACLSIYFFYRFAEANFGRKPALYASLFFASNGFLVAFGRIVQYQSVCILGMMLALYFLSKAAYDEKYSRWGIFWGLLAWALALLAHYDGVFIAPFALYLLYRWYRDSNLEAPARRRVLIFSAVVCGGLLALFYVPFSLSLSSDLLQYWGDRLSEDAGGTIPNSPLLFKVYQPYYALWIYSILFALGAGYLALANGLHYFRKTSLNAFFDGNKIFAPVRTRFSSLAKNAGPHKDISATGNLRGIGFSTDGTTEAGKALALLAWLLAALVFMEAIVYKPGTHIYTYLLPGFLFMGYGTWLIELLVKRVLGEKIGAAIQVAGVLAVSLFIFAQSYAIFVDHRGEYPWENEKFLFWTLPKPIKEFNEGYHLALFGFPYYRNWEGIQAFITAYGITSEYSTNERRSIARYYVPLTNTPTQARYYISITNPQSFYQLKNQRMKDLIAQYQPIYRYPAKGTPLAEIYLVTPQIIEELSDQGN
jgi:hypothetical protein